MKKQIVVGGHRSFHITSKVSVSGTHSQVLRPNPGCPGIKPESRSLGMEGGASSLKEVRALDTWYQALGTNLLLSGIK